MLPTVPSSLTANGDWSTLRAGVGSLEPAKRPERRGGGEIAAWRDGGWFFLLGGGEPVNAAMIDEHSSARDALACHARHVPSRIRSECAVLGSSSTPCSSTHTAATTVTEVATNVRLRRTRSRPRLNRTSLYRAPILSLRIRLHPDLPPSPHSLQSPKSPKRLPLTSPRSQRMYLQSTMRMKLGPPRGHARKLGELGPLACFPCSLLQSWQRL
jgi:hypothetical protein